MKNEKISQKYFVSFCIEGSAEESSDGLIDEIRGLLHGWVLRKERSFGRSEDELPPLSAFSQGGEWRNDRLRQSSCTTRSARLDGCRQAWGLFYGHAFEDASDEFVVLDFVATASSARERT